MNKFISLITLVLFTLTATSQTVKVVDKTTHQTLPGVTIYTSDFSLQGTTNTYGEFDIFRFKDADSIFFRHIGYKIIVYSYAQLSDSKFIVSLTESTISIGEVIVSSNRWEETQMETPNRIEKIAASEIAFQNPQTAADLIGISDYAYVQK